MNNQKFFLHPSAEVHPLSVIGQDCQIWNWTKLRENTKIGSKTKVGHCCYIDAGVTIGENCKIQNSVQIYQGVKIGDSVFIGPNVTFTNDKYPRAFNEKWEIIQTTVSNNASIGAGAVIVCGITLGQYSLVAAGSVVTKSVPDYGFVAGNPAKLIGFVDEYGKKTAIKL